jgi:hypothetical protein
MNGRVTVFLGLAAILLATMLFTGCAPALHSAARTGNLMEAQRLLDAGASTEERCSPNAYSTDFPLAAAAYNGHEEVVRLLLDRGADINARNPAGVTAIMFAATESKLRVVNLLLERGADIKLRDGWGWTALDRARKYSGNPQVIALLEQAEMKKAVDAAREIHREKTEKEQERISLELAGADLARLLEKSPENGQWAEALTKSLIQAKNKELPGFLASSTVEDRVALLTTVELRLSDAQALIARLNAMAEDAVRQGQSAVPLRDQVGKIQVYTGVLNAIRSMLLQS